MYRGTSSSNINQIPTFKEFVTFIINTTSPNINIWEKRKSATDRHWIPYYVNCAPCDVKYDVIATIPDTLSFDNRYKLCAILI